MFYCYLVTIAHLSLRFFFRVLQFDPDCVVFSRYWPFGQDGCAYHGFHGMISVLASISFMAAIAWDRYHQYCTSE